MKTSNSSYKYDDNDLWVVKHKKMVGKRKNPNETRSNFLTGKAERKLNTQTNSYKQNHIEDSSFRNNGEIEYVKEVDEMDELDLPVNQKSGRKIKIKTQVFVSDSSKETPNIADHLSPNLNSNMNLLFYNFNNSRANTASGGKRGPSLGVEME